MFIERNTKNVHKKCNEIMKRFIIFPEKIGKKLHENFKYFMKILLNKVNIL